MAAAVAAAAKVMRPDRAEQVAQALDREKLDRLSTRVRRPYVIYYGEAIVLENLLPRRDSQRCRDPQRRLEVRGPRQRPIKHLQYY